MVHFNLKIWRIIKWQTLSQFQIRGGSYDGDMVVKQYSSMTINTGDTITTGQCWRFNDFSSR